jgi:hypothetical protein
MIQEGLLEKLAVPTDRGAAICVKLTDKGKELLRKQTSQNLGLEINAAVDEGIMLANIDDQEFVWTSKCTSSLSSIPVHPNAEDTRPSHGVGLQRQIIALLDANPCGLIIRVKSPFIRSRSFLTIILGNIHGPGKF